MKQLLRMFALSLTFSAFVVAPVAAQGLFSDACSRGAGQNSTVCTESKKTTNPLSGNESLLVKATDIVLFVVGVAAVFLVIIGGIRYILANGDSGKIIQARDTIIYAIVGLIIALAARSIIVVVVNRL